MKKRVFPISITLIVVLVLFIYFFKTSTDKDKYNIGEQAPDEEGGYEYGYREADSDE